LENTVAAFKIVSGMLTALTISTIAMWKKLGGFVHKDELNEAINKEADHRIKVNMNLVQRMTAVETKIEMGFKMLGEKIDKNGGSK